MSIIKSTSAAPPPIANDASGCRADDGSRRNIAISRFDGTWDSAVFAETQPGHAISPHASASGGQALLGWIQSEDGANHVKARLQAL